MGIHFMRGKIMYIFFLHPLASLVSLQDLIFLNNFIVSDTFPDVVPVPLASAVPPFQSGRHGHVCTEAAGKDDCKENYL